MSRRYRAADLSGEPERLIFALRSTRRDSLPGRAAGLAGARRAPRPSRSDAACDSAGHPRADSASSRARTAASPSPRPTAPGNGGPLLPLPGGEDQLLPSWRQRQSADPDDVEVERRLFYVAATRAKDHLVLT